VNTFKETSTQEIKEALQLWMYKTESPARGWITIEEFPEGFKACALNYIDPTEYFTTKAMSKTGAERFRELILENL
jgi:hypothetical protein